jgi:hypothetical protein
MRATLAIFLVLFLTSCHSEPATKQQDYFRDCLYSAPEPIFIKHLSAIKFHEFQLNRERGVEKVSFDNGLELEIIQTGCNQMKQEFRFSIYGNMDNKEAEFWIQQAGKYFFYLGALDEYLLPLYEWGELLIRNAPYMQLNKNFEVVEGFLVRVAIRQGNPEKAILIVAISEQ